MCLKILINFMSTNNSNTNNMSGEPTTKRIYRKQSTVIKKFLDKDGKNALTTFTKNCLKQIKINLREGAKEDKKMKKEQEKQAKKNAKEDEKMKIKEEKEKAKAENRLMKEEEKMRIKLEKKEKKKQEKEEKKNAKKTEVKGGNVMSVINTEPVVETQVNLMEEARNEVIEQELQEETYISVDEITALALSEEPKKDDTKKPRIKGRGRPKKANIEAVKAI